jgi:hypothetical protein
MAAVVSGHKAKRRVQQNPPPKPRPPAAPQLSNITTAPEPAKTCGCGYCDTIAWIHDDCDPNCGCEEGN